MTVAQWMWGDSNRLISLHWSRQVPVADVVSDLRKVDGESAGLAIRVYIKDEQDLVDEREYVFGNAAEAVQVLGETPEGSDSLHAIDVFRLRRAETHREDSVYSWPPSAPKEQCRQCIECGSSASDSCQVCGLSLCTQPRIAGFRCLTVHPLTAGGSAVDAIKTCRRCADYATARSLARASYRSARAASFRSALAGSNLGYCLAAITPPLELAEDCAGCGRVVSKGSIVPGSMRHHCRACGRTLCAICLCGSLTCMSNHLTCPHKLALPHYGYERPERVCRECLSFANVRQAAREAWEKIAQTACKYAEHCNRVVDYLDDPAHFPLYKQDYVDTAKNKVVRAGNLAVSGVKLVTPLLSMPWAMGVNAVHAAWNYGQYGLLGLFCSEEITQGIKTLHSMSKELEAIEPRELLVGLLYLTAEQRRVARSAPEADHEEAMAHGRPVDEGLLELLIGMAGIGMHAPYEDKAFEVQRFALQQNWRLVTERLSESWKHQPAWCLYIHKEQRIASVAIRGTDLEKSLGGDVFTDVNALPERACGADGATVVAHSGMLASARAIEPEIRQALRALVARGYRIIFVGHSLGAGVVALLMWLLKHGAGEERLPGNAELFGVGYAMPSVMDFRSAEAMKPYFTSVINPVDIVPRLTLTSLQQLTKELVTCARESHVDLDADVQGYVDRIASVWAPKLRTGTHEQPGQQTSESHQRSAPVHSLLRRGSQVITAAFTRASSLEGVGSPSSAPAGAEGPDGVDAGVGPLQAQADPAEPDDGQAASSGPPLPPSPQTQLLEGHEGYTLWVPGGVESVHLAWYGDPLRPWQVKEDVGRMCSEEVKSTMTSSNMVIISNRTLGDPCPGKRKVLLVLVEAGKTSDLFCPGVVVWTYRHQGSLQAAMVPCDLPPLRRIHCDRRMITDHGKLTYHRALLTVRARRAAARSVTWQSFAVAGENCPCCHSVYDWQSTTQSVKQRSLWMTNCRACGQVVCTSCASTRQALPEFGIIDPARVCDSCAWRGSDGFSALAALPSIFESASQGGAPSSGEGRD